jgi:hypothetical protein
VTQFDACVDNPSYDRKGCKFMMRCQKAYRFASVLTSYSCVNVKGGNNTKRPYLELLYNCVWAVPNKPRQISIFIRKATQDEKQRYIDGSRDFRPSINSPLYDNEGNIKQ